MAIKYEADKMDELLASSKIFKEELTLKNLLEVGRELNDGHLAMAAGGFIKHVVYKDGKKVSASWFTWSD